ncbi:MAG: hypothetical protein JWM11_4294, partial [Planctomycetaceae bacterium]|nr:hypothetical protein [Planctomycetaceae bacterium]
MSLELVSLLVFFACIVVSVTLWMVIRDLIWGPGGEDRLRPRSLRRVFNVQDQEPATTLTGKLDQGFEHLVLESGF